MSEQDGVFGIGRILNIHTTNRIAPSRSGPEDLDTLQFPVSVLPLGPIRQVEGAGTVLFVLEVVRGGRRRKEGQLGSDTWGQGGTAEQVTELWQREAVHLSQLSGWSHRRRRPTLQLLFLLGAFTLVFLLTYSLEKSRRHTVCWSGAAKVAKYQIKVYHKKITSSKIPSRKERLFRDKSWNEAAESG